MSYNKQDLLTLHEHLGSFGCGGVFVAYWYLVFCVWFLFCLSSSYAGADPEGAPPARAPPKIGKYKIFWRKIVFFHTKYPNNFRASLRSAQFFKVRPLPLTWNPGSAPDMWHNVLCIIFPVSLDCSFLIALSVFSNIYLFIVLVNMWKMLDSYLRGKALKHNRKDKTTWVKHTYATSAYHH